jgi:hypothetical protein
MNKDKRMRGLVESCHKSGMGPTKFASTNGVSLYQLKYWVKKLKESKPSSPGFIQITPSPTSLENQLVEIVYPNGVKIKLTTGDLPFLRQLISRMHTT